MASKRRMAAALMLVFATLSATPTRAPAAAGRSVSLSRAFRATTDDSTSRIDANTIDMIVTNRGSFAYDRKSGLGGLVWPKGSGKTALFAAGPWFGALVNGDTLVAVSDYSDHYGPGSIVGG